ncbi:MAG: hypothetical protein HY350_02225 [Candidatus Omnitrophica bacterium]|nr:hypothetical protein [Candidatus Omnitrophota bacterium]
MKMDIFVGNLSFAAKEADVKKLFEGFGNVVSVKIVMEKKGTKSRGFGFVQMPDEQEAQAAIAALSGNEFMGRPLNVMPARPKPGAVRDMGEAKEIRPEPKAESQQHLKKEAATKDAWFSPVFNKKRSRYKTGRRSLSYMKRRAASGMSEAAAMPKEKSRENPLRWRKRHEQPKPWQKSRGEAKPWEKSEGESRPWKKPAGGSKPWDKKEGKFKPWRKPVGEPKPWQKKEGEFKPWVKSAGEPKSWQKSRGEAKPWKKPAGESKSRRNSGKRPRPRQSRIENRRKPGGYAR